MRRPGLPVPRQWHASRWGIGVVLVCLIAGLLLGTARSYSAGEDISNRSVDLSAVVKRASGLQAAAGLTPVQGPGLRVTLSDAPRDADGNYPAGVDPDDLVVHQQDVQAVVNAMWAGGAEAMMIMDQRVLTTSAVRCIGNTLLLQGRTYSPPFVVTAIGDADAMVAALDDQPGVRLYRQYVDKFQLVYDVTPVDNVTLPAWTE